MFTEDDFPFLLNEPEDYHWSYYWDVYKLIEALLKLWKLNNKHFKKIEEVYFDKFKSSKAEGNEDIIFLVSDSAKILLEIISISNDRKVFYSVISKAIGVKNKEIFIDWNLKLFISAKTYNFLYPNVADFIVDNFDETDYIKIFWGINNSIKSKIWKDKEKKGG